MFCPNCGKQIKIVKFCPYCGKAIKTPNINKAQEPPMTQPPQPPQTPQSPLPPVNIDYLIKDSAAKKAKTPKEKKPKTKRKKPLLISIISVLTAIVLCVSAFFAYKIFFDETVIFKNFEASSTYLVANETNTVTFTVESNIATDNISLYEDDQHISQMYDNGENGDSVANDKIYTCEVELEKVFVETTSLSYQCKADDDTSDKLDIYYFAKLSEDEAEEAKEEYNELSQDVQTIEERFADETGFVPTEKYKELFAEIVEEIEDAKEEGLVLHYESEENSIYVKMTSGLSMVYVPKTENTDSMGKDVEATIITLQPSFTEMGGADYGSDFYTYDLPEGVNYKLEMLDVAARNLSNTLPNFKFKNSNNCDDEAVTLEKVRSISKNQVVLWHGHGYYGSVVKSCLVTGETFDWDAWWWDIEYFNDCVSNRIINSILLDCDEVIISSKYIEKYCGDMSNSFIYLAACSSGKHPGLANAFTDKGAVVVANSETIIRDYNVAMLYGTVNEMIKVNPKTEKFYTLSEALANAKKTYGNDDSDSRYGGVGATPVIFGKNQKEANNYCFAEEVPTGVISGKVCKASDRITPIKNAKIEVYVGGTVIKETTSDANGQYELEIPIGQCDVKISAKGYITYSCFNQIRAGATIHMETFLMVAGKPSQKGIASGKIINSISGQGIGDVSLTIYKNWNADISGSTEEPVLTSISDDNGNYSVKLPYGNYTVVLEKENFSKSSFNIVVQKGNTKNQDGTITPEINGNDYLITLTWDENPRDVDSHMEGYLSNNSKFHVYYSHKTAYENGETLCNLDYDDTNSYGPEHITLNAKGTKPYYYYLHKFAGSGSLATSGAKVTIEQSNVLIAEFNVPTNLGSGDYWNIFAIVDGEIIVNNTITSTPNTSYAEE